MGRGLEVTIIVKCFEGALEVQGNQLYATELLDDILWEVYVKEVTTITKCFEGVCWGVWGLGSM